MESFEDDSHDEEANNKGNEGLFVVTVARLKFFFRNPHTKHVIIMVVTVIYWEGVKLPRYII